MVKCRQFNDALNFSDGETRRPYRVPEFVPEAQVRAAKEGFRKVCRYIREQKRFENLSVGGTAKVYSGTVPALGRAELEGFAARVREKRTILPCEPVSPAEQALAFARAIARPGAKSLSARVKVDRVLGPMEEPHVSPDCDWLSWARFQALAREFVRFAEAKGLRARQPARPRRPARRAHRARDPVLPLRGWRLRVGRRQARPRPRQQRRAAVPVHRHGDRIARAPRLHGLAHLRIRT